jgi:nitroreductase
MKDFFEILNSRVSVKSYLDTPVEKQQLQQIVEAGTHAPTGRNKQSPIILAVTNKTLRDKLSALNAKILGTDTDPFYNAPCVLVVLADKSVNTRVYDGSVVMENMLLAAHALGLGACWIHRARETFETEEGKQILKELGIEGEYEGVGNCVVGHAKITPSVKPRKENWVYYVE